MRASNPGAQLHNLLVRKLKLYYGQTVCYQLISSSDFIKPPLEKKSNSDKEYKNSKESPVEGKADNTDGEDHFKIENHKDNKNDKELIVEMAT